MKQGKTFVRKHFFIDRKLQGRYMLTFLVPMLVMLVFMLFTLYAAAETVVGATTAIIKQGISDKEAAYFQDNPAPDAGTYQAFVREVKNYLRDFASDSAYRRAVMNALLWVFGVGLLLVIVQIGLLTVFFSHKLAGPIYRFERLCHSIIDGDYSGEVVLRKGDEMKNLATLFNEVMRKTRERMKAIETAPDEESRKKIVTALKV